jgi:diaminopimelate epimerase
MTSQMKSSKWHALGNAYLVVARDDLERPLDASLARDLSTEAGSDGVVEMIDVRDSEADVQIWNPDGSRAEFSGNGARIAAAWLAERSGSSDIRLHFGAREAVARVDGTTVALDIGAVETGAPEELDLGRESVTFTPVSVANPHAVIRRDFGKDDARRLGPLVENHARFPERTNVQLVRVLGSHEIEIAIWERGAGETTASGSSSVAAAAAAIASGWCETPVKVRQRGGELLVELTGDGRATLTGPVEKIG